jgi:glucose/arabinose dehydrogenase
VEVFASGLMGGYGFHFLPDRRILVSERGGRLRLVSTDGTVAEPLGGLPKIYSRGPQGLCDVIPDEDFSHNRTLYLS